MPVNHDGETNLSGHLASANPQDIPGTKICSGANGFVVVDLELSGGAFAGGEPTSVEYNGVAMTQIGSGVANGVGVRSYGLVNPPGTSTLIRISLTNPTSLGYVVRSFNGVNQSTPTSGVQTATGTDTAPTSPAVTSAVGDMVLDATAAQAPYNADDDETVDGTMTDGGSYDARATRIAGAASVTMSHSLSGSGNWAIQAFNLLQAAGGPQGQGEVIASSPPRFPRLMARLRG